MLGREMVNCWQRWRTRDLVLPPRFGRHASVWETVAMPLLALMPKCPTVRPGRQGQAPRGTPELDVPRTRRRLATESPGPWRRASISPGMPAASCQLQVAC